MRLIILIHAANLRNIRNSTREKSVKIYKTDYILTFYDSFVDAIKNYLLYNNKRAFDTISEEDFYL